MCHLPDTSRPPHSNLQQNCLHSCWRRQHVPQTRLLPQWAEVQPCTSVCKSLAVPQLSTPAQIYSGRQHQLTCPPWKPPAQMPMLPLAVHAVHAWRSGAQFLLLLLLIAARSNASALGRPIRLSTRSIRVAAAPSAWKLYITDHGNPEGNGPQHSQSGGGGAAANRPSAMYVGALEVDLPRSTVPCLRLLMWRHEAQAVQHQSSLACLQVVAAHNGRLCSNFDLSTEYHLGRRLVAQRGVTRIARRLWS